MEVELKVLFDITTEAAPSQKGNIEDIVYFVQRYISHQIGVTNVRSYVNGLGE